MWNSALQVLATDVTPNASPFRLGAEKQFHLLAQTQLLGGWNHCIIVKLFFTSKITHDYTGKLIICWHHWSYKLSIITTSSFLLSVFSETISNTENQVVWSQKRGNQVGHVDVGLSSRSQLRQYPWTVESFRGEKWDWNDPKAGFVYLYIEGDCLLFHWISHDIRDVCFFFQVS